MYIQWSLIKKKLQKAFFIKEVCNRRIKSFSVLANESIDLAISDLLLSPNLTALDMAVIVDRSIVARYLAIPVSKISALATNRG